MVEILIDKFIIHLFNYSFILFILICFTSYCFYYQCIKNSIVLVFPVEIDNLCYSLLFKIKE